MSALFDEEVILRNYVADERADERLNMVLNMLQEKCSIDLIARVSGLAVPEIERLATEQCTPRNTPTN